MEAKPTWSRRIKCGLIANVLMTDISHGNLSIIQPINQLHQKQRNIIDAPWSYLDQVHSGDVIRVQDPGHCQGEKGDGMVTTTLKTPLSIQTADCAPVALISDAQVLGIVHAGWRGLLSGIIQNACNEMIKLGGAPLTAIVGPCIHAQYYEFGEADLESMMREFGPTVRSKTKEGTLALDIPETVKIALERNNVEEIYSIGNCTAESKEFWSYRAGQDIERQAMVAWLEETK
jgi:YfiH family protein